MKSLFMIGLFFLIHSASASPLVLSQQIEESRASEVQQYLKEFHAAPATVMHRPLIKRDQQGNVVSKTESLFSTEQIENRSFVTARDEYRKKIRKNAGEMPLTGVWGNDLVENLVDNWNLVRRLEDIQSRGLMSVGLEIEPWSDDYWGFYRGSLGARYADPQFPNSKYWDANYSYVLENPVTEMLYRGQTAIDTLSPSEKYDLLVGDDNGTLTTGMWEMGRNFKDHLGLMDTWMGICEGWAAASIMSPRPLKQITLPAAHAAVQINFYPSDIKALSSLLWAYGDKPVRFVGGRCEDKSPAADANGRVISPTCFDTNPMTWHLAVVNQIGVSRRSFVIDAVYDYEVWNQPMFGYTYNYFNPITGNLTQNLQEAKVPLNYYTQDKFKKYRSPEAVYVIGIAMDITYMSEIIPVQRPTDSWLNDAARVVRYIYDLELDAYGNIIGGEWYTALHPDFLWSVPRGSNVVSVGDGYISEPWINGRVPISWRNAAAMASQYRQPLASIVDRLIRMANQ